MPRSESELVWPNARGEGPSHFEPTVVLKRPPPAETEAEARGETDLRQNG